MGKESSFLPPEMQSCMSFPTCTRGRCHTFFLEVHPSPAPHFSPKCNAIFPHKSSPICMWRRILPLQNANSTNPSLQILGLISLFFILFSFIYIFHFVLLYFFKNYSRTFLSYFFSKTWNFSPKLKNYFPAFGANNRRIDAPALKRVKSYYVTL